MARRFSQSDVQWPTRPGTGSQRQRLSDEDKDENDDEDKDEDARRRDRKFLRMCDCRGRVKFLTPGIKKTA